MNLVAIEAKAGNTQLHGASVPRVHDASAFGVVGSSITSYATRSARTVSIGQIRIADPPPQYETRRSNRDFNVRSLVQGAIELRATDILLVDDSSQNTEAALVMPECTISAIP